MKTIAIVSQKGGSGKTTIATNLAVAAALDHKPAFVFDLDQQPNAYGWYQARATQDGSDGLNVVPSHHAALSRLLDQAARSGTAFAILDTAPRTEVASRIAIEAADVVLIPCIPSAHDVRAIQDTLEMCRLLNVRPYVVLNEVEATSPLTGEARALLEQLKASVLSTTIGLRRAFKHTASDGRGVLEYDPHSIAADEVRALYRAVVKLTAAAKRKKTR